MPSKHRSQEAVNYTYFSTAVLVLGVDTPDCAYPNLECDTYMSHTCPINKATETGLLSFSEKIKCRFSYYLNKMSRTSEISKNETILNIMFL